MRPVDKYNDRKQVIMRVERPTYLQLREKLHIEGVKLQHFFTKCITEYLRGNKHMAKMIESCRSQRVKKLKTFSDSEHMRIMEQIESESPLQDALITPDDPFNQD